MRQSSCRCGKWSGPRPWCFTALPRSQVSRQQSCQPTEVDLLRMQGDGGFSRSSRCVTERLGQMLKEFVFFFFFNPVVVKCLSWLSLVPPHSHTVGPPATRRKLGQFSYKSNFSCSFKLLKCFLQLRSIFLNIQLFFLLLKAEMISFSD